MDATSSSADALYNTSFFFILVIYTIDIFITPFILFLTPSSSLAATLPYILTHSPPFSLLHQLPTTLSFSPLPFLPAPLTPSLPLCSFLPCSLLCNQRAAKPSLLHSGITAGLLTSPNYTQKRTTSVYENGDPFSYSV